MGVDKQPQKLRAGSFVITDFHRQKLTTVMSTMKSKPFVNTHIVFDMTSPLR